MAGLAILCNGSAALAAVVAHEPEESGSPGRWGRCVPRHPALPAHSDPRRLCEHFLVGRHLPAIDWSVFGTAASWVEAACQSLKGTPR